MLKWTKRLAILFASLLGVVAVVIGGYVWRSMPQLDGTLNAVGLSQAVTIKRDASDVTHIEAKNDRDAAFALGYVHAQERSWQLEFNRRIMHGRLSEFLGEPTLETDKLMRTLGIMEIAKAQFANLPAAVKDGLQAYSDGINAFHATSSQALPPEFRVLGIKPGLWTPLDSVGWSIMMALDLGGNWGTEIARLSASRVLDTQRMWQMYPVFEGEKPKGTADLSKLYAALGVYKVLGTTSTGSKTAAIDDSKVIALNPMNPPTKGIFDVKNPFLSAQAALQQALAQPMARMVDEIGHGDAQVTGRGSNNWVVAGSRTQSGKPLVANDPHLGLSAPAIWYFAAIKTPTNQAVGATLPGMPYVILGRNAHVAWGFTNTGPDVQDVYIERIDPANPKRYQTPTGWSDFTERAEVIKVKALPDVNLNVRGTRHGPVLSDSLKNYDWIDTSKVALSLRWSALDSDNQTLRAGMEAMGARTVPELFAAFQHYQSPAQNLVAADVDGRTGYKVIGKLPIRAPNDIMGAAPMPGWDASYDWTGWVAYADNPGDNGVTSNRRNAAFKGKSELIEPGWLATANQRIHDTEFPHFMGQDWAQSYRFDRINALLAQTPKHDAKSLARVQGDVTSLATIRLLPHFRAAVSASASGAVPDAIKTAAAAWDGSMAADSSLPLIFSTWMDQFTRDVLLHRLGETRFKAQYGRRQFRAGIESILESNDVFWCKVDCKTASANALNLAMADIRLKSGEDPSQWLWGAHHMAVSRHNPLGNVALLAKAFDVRVPTGGDGFTVNVGQYSFADKKAPFANRHAASMRAIYDLADLEKSQFIYQTGQSGNVFSGRYRDMSTTWAGVQYRSLQLNPTSWAHELQLSP